TIVTVTNDQVLQGVSTTDFEFAIDNSATYRYFRFEVSAVQSGDSFQLGELRFRGKTPTNSRILTGLLPETEYAIKVRANIGESFSVWSEEVHIKTFDGITFYVDGNWNEAGNWNVSRVPGTDDNVNIAAQAVVPAGYTAQVQNTNVIGGGSITIEDGGQFIAENEVKVTMQKNISAWTTDPVGGWYFIAPPVNTEDLDYGDTGLITEGEGKDYDLYRLNTTTWENYKAEGGHHHFDLDRGRGYLYASENGTEITFNGNAMPYSETPIPLADGFNLIGNPYTFNTFVNRPYYKLNNARTNIELVNDNTVIAPCEGVLIDVEGTDQVTFTQTDQLSQASNNGNLDIVVEQQTSHRGISTIVDKAVVSFNEGSRLGKFYFMEQDAHIYLPQDGKDYAVAFSEKQGEMPLYFKAMKKGNYTITVVPERIKVDYLHLIDNLTGTDVDLLVASSYTFEARTDDYASRFRLVFNVSDHADQDDFAFISNGELIVNGTGNLQIFDVLGHELLRKELSTPHSSHFTPHFTSGVYVLRLINGENVRTQKIILP
ncbi:MAG: T9SS type A sorting domain-containing protein, partial [Bacteroidales bacterium]|nr:T9SS type A sorting domain-containing protein [Bacteroidales bacterium]